MGRLESFVYSHVKCLLATICCNGEYLIIPVHSLLTFSFNKVGVDLC